MLNAISNAATFMASKKTSKGTVLIILFTYVCVYFVLCIYIYIYILFLLSNTVVKEDASNIKSKGIQVLGDINEAKKLPPSMLGENTYLISSTPSKDQRGNTLTSLLPMPSSRHSPLLPLSPIVSLARLLSFIKSLTSPHSDTKAS